MKQSEQENNQNLNDERILGKMQRTGIVAETEESVAEIVSLT